MMDNVTERSSKYRHLEQMSTEDLLANINREDQTVAYAVEQVIPQIEKLVDAISARMKAGGRLFYIGAGTSGRLGILDASECPPTFGVSEDWVIGIIAGGDRAIRKSIEFAEDNTMMGWKDLSLHHPRSLDVVVGIAASGHTPYVVHTLKTCQENNITTGCITCNLETPLAKYSDFPIEVVVGAEFVTGSTRMKAGTAQKMILNMISTSVMIKLGRILDNAMVDMQLSNTKLQSRGVRILMEMLNLTYEDAKAALAKAGSVRKALKIGLHQ